MNARVLLSLLVEQSTWATALAHFVLRSWGFLLQGVGSTTLGVVVFSFSVPTVTLVISFGVNYASLRRRPLDPLKNQALKDSILPTLISMGAVALVLVALFCYYAAKTGYAEHVNKGARIQTLEAERQALASELERKRQNLDWRDPAYHNMLDTIEAFQAYRRIIGENVKCQVLITQPVGAGTPADVLAPFALIGGDCPNGDLQNIGVKPESVEEESRKGEVAGIVLLHAAPGTKGADRLVDLLGNLIQTRRSYKMPTGASQIPDNIIWLQFGPGTKWNTELQQ